MPLMPGKSRKAFGHNVATEMEHGKPQKQAVAIAYHEAGEKKMAKGGMCMSCGGEMPCRSHGGEMSEMDDSAMDDELNDMIADELQQALDQKDKKGILEAIRALVLNCKE